MTESQGKWFKSWKHKRQKGMAYYLFIQTLIVGGALFLGKLIGVAFFTNQNQWGEFFTDLPITVVLILAIGIPLNAVFWFIGEWRYRNLSSTQERT
ncbi:hypothetical protein D8S93_24105 [Vibrio sp. VGrn 2]|uniref:hypothetical protein n=1 Tax=Vibrio sp. VGrn 2 TaxID=2419839 RepID=UPI0029D41381|nr:hypothetical protein [Vibrio sp. VGrn 2]MPS41656.1 hypothetical protein [Vibrio sp. VGrn 2]